MTAPGTSERNYVAPLVNEDRVVRRPMPQRQAEDPREFQIGQIRRRFHPEEQVAGDATVFTFKMAPSDPDFPFDIETLDCALRVCLTI